MTRESPALGALPTDDESVRLEALVGAGIRAPLELDLVCALRDRAGAFAAADALATSCGAGQREAVAALEALARAGIVVRRRFYNLSEYATPGDPEGAARLRALAGEVPGETRRLRRALLARQLAGTR